MRVADRVVVKVFAKPEEDAESVRQGLADLVPGKPIQESRAQGFNERMIKIFRVELLKSSEINAFLRHLLGLLSLTQRDLLAAQADSRLDDRFNFFVRVDKRPWVERRKLFFTDSGDCFHVSLSLAVFPKKRDIALRQVKDLFGGGIG